MWLTGLALAVWAAEDPVGTGTSSGEQLAVVIGGIATAFIGGIVAVTVAMINSRANRTDPSPPSPTPTALGLDAIALHERVAVLERRADDSDERDELQDRRLDQHERALDIDNPNWHHPS